MDVGRGEEAAAAGKGVQVEDVVADGDGGTRGGVGGRGDDAKGDVGEGEVRAGGMGSQDMVGYLPSWSG